MIRERTILDTREIDEALHRDSDMPLGDEVIDDPARPRARRLRPAAVLLPLARQRGEWHLLFIRRATNDRDRHSGQVAFPGGARDPGDESIEATALREAREEIGLAASRVTLLHTLRPYVTISLYEVTPVAAIIEWPVPLDLQPSEVARAFLIPLDWLRDRANFTLRDRLDIDPRTAGGHPVVHYLPYDDETLWGASARITLNFLKSIDDGEIVLP